MQFLTLVWQAFAHRAISAALWYLRQVLTAQAWLAWLTVCSTDGLELAVVLRPLPAVCDLRYVHHT